ncbi:hypothetical protein D3C86_1805940 [compost metagenome]
MACICTGYSTETVTGPCCRAAQTRSAKAAGASIVLAPQQNDKFDGLLALGPAGAPPIPARLEGHHFDGQLVFTKFPNGGGQTHSIDYVGSISADGNSIAGRWVIHGDWSGTFRMQRRPAPINVALDVAATA